MNDRQKTKSCIFVKNIFDSERYISDPKLQIILDAFSKYCDSNIGLFSHSVIALQTLLTIQLLLFHFCPPYSY